MLPVKPFCSLIYFWGDVLNILRGFDVRVVRTFQSHPDSKNAFIEETNFFFAADRLVDCYMR